MSGRYPWGLAFLIGVVAGLVGSMLGIGGGLVMTPAFVLLLGMALPEAIGTSLGVIPFLAAAAVATELLVAPEHLHFDLALILCVGGIPGTLLGFRLVQRLRVRLLGRIFAVFLVIAALQVVHRIPWQNVAHLPPILLAPCGLLAGVAASMFGIGGGLIAVPILLFARGDLTFLEARATSLIMVTILSSAGALWFSRARLSHGRLILPVVPGALLGSIVGVRVVQLVPEQPLRWVFAAMLLYTAWRVLRRTAG